jgi:hypothetical protein
MRHVALVVGTTTDTISLVNFSPNMKKSFLGKAFCMQPAPQPTQEVGAVAIKTSGVDAVVFDWWRRA